MIRLGAGLIVPYFDVYLKYMLDTAESLVGLILSFVQLGTVIAGWIMTNYTNSTPYAYTILIYIIRTLIFFSNFNKEIVSESKSL